MNLLIGGFRTKLAFLLETIFCSFQGYATFLIPKVVEALEVEGFG